MKWINCVAWLFMIPAVLSGDELLTLSSPQNGSLKHNNKVSSKIVWLGNDKYLESWELSCTLSFPLMTSGDLFYSYGVYNYGYTFNPSDSRYKGISFGISKDNVLYFSHNEQIINLDDFILKSGDSSYNLSVSFITTYDPEEKKNISGSVLLTLNEQAFSYEIKEPFLEYCYLRNETVFSETTYPVLYTHHACDYSNIVLKKLDNRIAPESQSSIFLSISLLVLGLYRRRR